MSENATRMVYLVKLIQVLEQRGLPVGSVVQAAGLSTHDLKDPDGMLSLDQYVAAVELACQLHDPYDLGFQVGLQTQMEEHGVLGYALLSASNFGDSLSRYLKYQSLQGPLLAVHTRRDRKQVVMTATPSARCLASPWQVHRYMVQEWLVSWNQWARLIGVGSFLFSEVTLGCKEPGSLDCYGSYLGCQVQLGQAQTHARFPSGYLDQTLDFANQQVAKLCDEQCTRILKELDLGHGLVAEIHRLLATSPGAIPRMGAVAASLHMDPRTLRRRLKREGTTYQEVIIRFRLTMARRYLRETSLPVNEIATLVGYSDPANLYRTFSSQTGRSPQAYRDQAALEHTN